MRSPATMTPDAAATQPCAQPAAAPQAVGSGRALEAALGLGLLPYFLVRGWLNAALLVLGLACMVLLARRREGLAPLLAQPALRWLMVALTAPLAAVAAVQAAHGELVPRYFEVPLRLVLSIPILLCLAQRRVDVVRMAGWVFPIAALSCAALVLLSPGASRYYWDGHAASYFMDPLMLAQHATIAGFLCLFSAQLDPRAGLGWRALRYAGFLAGLAVSVATHSRTGWTLFPVLAALWLIGIRRQNGRLRIAAALLAVALACALMYAGSATVQSRVDEAGRDLAQYFHGGDRDTSLGIRISLLRANWALFLQQPWRGWGFTGVPPLAAVPGIQQYFTPLFEGYFIRSGAHNEIMQSLMRMGLPGLVSRLLLFGVPLLLFARAARASGSRRAAGYLGLAVVLGYLGAGASTEVINLVYAGSFYALLVAAFAAATFHETHP
ncbi:MAG TPA: O-antigen ligase family protein [Ramlibacter sp.]|nr:O-antigen ligase family protein [Ramlibacter sp.]